MAPPLLHRAAIIKIPVHKGAIFRQDMPGHVQQLISSKLEAEFVQKWYSADARWSVLDGMHIGTTWQIRLNCPYVVAVWPSVKLL